MYLDSSPKERLISPRPDDPAHDFWIPDKSTKSCSQCDRAFNFFNRRHHCRICGHIFCSNCSFKREVEPLGMKKGSHHKEVIRVCEYCNGTLNDYISRVRESAVLIKKNIPQRSRGSLSELEFSQILQAKKLGRTDNLTIQPVMETEEDLTQEQKHNLIASRSIATDNHSNYDGALLLGELEDQVEEEVSFDMDDFLNDGRRKISPLDKALTMSQNLDPHSTCLLFDYAQKHIRDAVRQLSIQEGISDEWHSLLSDFTIKAVQNVKSSSRLLNDSMDFTHFVRIKRISWPDRSRSRFIHGVMATKNIADKRMASRINNPKILLISAPLEFYGRRNSSKGYAAIESLIQQESYYLGILKLKIQLLKPDIIVTQANVSRNVLDQLRKEGVTVITNVKHSVMVFLARCTQTIILPSVDLIDKGVVLGTCERFHVTKNNDYRNPTYVHRRSQSQSEYPYYQSLVLTEQDIVKVDRSKIVFEGCNPILGCTMAVSGPDPVELIHVKNVLRKAIKFARNIVLERGYLLQCGLELPVPPGQDPTQLNPEYSPFLGKHLNLLNNEKIILSQYKMVLGHGKQVNESNETSDMMLPKVKNQALAGAAGILFQTSMNDMSESKIKEHLDRMCGKQKMQRLYFYEGQDQPLGAFINEKMSAASQKCEQCKRANHIHYRCLYMVSGRLKISISVIKDLDTEESSSRRRISSSHNRNISTQSRFFNPLGSTGRNISKEGRITSTAMRAGQAQHEANFREPILTYNFCKICRRRVTPRETMNNEYYEYSLSCFLLQYFLNDKLIMRARKDSSSGSPSPTRATHICGHTGHRAITRVFRQGHTFLKMDFQPKERYQFQPLYLLPKLKEQPTAQEDREIKQIEDVITIGVTTLNRYIKHLKESVKREIEDVKLKVGLQNSIEALYIKEPQLILLNRLCKIVGELEDKTEKDIAKWREIKKQAEKHFLQRVLLSHSLQYHIMLSLRKFQLIVKHLVSCYLNVLYYALEAQSKVVQRVTHDSSHIWPMEESVREKEMILEMIEMENFEIQNPPFSFLKTGSNGCFVSVDQHNWGSFIAYILVSDVYREVLATQNYFNLKNEVQNFPTQSPATFKGGVVVHSQKRKPLISKDLLSSHTSRRSTPQLQPEGQAKQEGGKTWYLHREENSGKILKQESKNVIPSSFDVFNSQSVKDELVQDQLLKDTRVHMTFRFSCDKQTLGVRINRDGIYKSNDFFPSLKVVSNSISNFNQIFADTASPQLYFNITNLLHQIDSWSLQRVERDLDMRLAEGPRQSRAHKTTHQDTLEKCTSVMSYGSSSPSRCISPHNFGQENEFIAIYDEQEQKEKVLEAKRSPRFQDQLNSSYQSLTGMMNTEPDKSNYVSSRTVEVLSPRLQTIVPNLDLRSNNNDFLSRRKDSYFSGGGGSEYRKGIDFTRALREHEDPTIFELTVYYANKFEAMRRYYVGSIDEFVNSVAKSSSWSENSGGKSGSEFFITKDKRFIFKKIPKQEMGMFLSMGMVYFRHMAKHFFHRMPSLMAKTLGVYKLVIKQNEQSRKPLLKIYFLLQENLFYKTHPENVVAYDLKGSEKRRYVKKMEEKSKTNNEELKQDSEAKGSKVLLDTNYQEDFKGQPIPVSSATKIYIEAALNNDSLMLSKVNVMDYSLLAILDHQRNVLRAGIIDYMRQYTFDKMLEHSLKLVANAGLQPTITNPEIYRKRFLTACDTYFVGMFAKGADKICNPAKP